MKHIQKVGLLLHCISSDSLDPIKDYEIVRKEIGNFSKQLLEKKEVILLTKNDLLDVTVLGRVKKILKKLKRDIIATSIYDNKSIEKLHKKLM